MRIGDSFKAHPFAVVESIAFESGGHTASGFRLRLKLKARVVGSRHLEPFIAAGSSESHDAFIRLRGVDVGIKGEHESLTLGWFRAERNGELRRAHESDVGEVAFVLDVEGHVLTRVEDMRRAGKIAIDMTTHGDLYRDGLAVPGGVSGTGQLDYDRERWTEFLTSTGYCDFIHLEIAVPRGPEAEQHREALLALKDALAQLQHGHHEEVLSRCRKALEVLKQDSFGGHVPPRDLQVHQEHG